ncbi:efflux RND transporter permease subunit [Gemmata sp. JC673]|uniref:Efflux RND transporter permease subunit n=1 Tax=Gemmata algarum TaxID=2975278 RepID=A0ABU5F5H4_9BACT|nr:efflux RND transporter permease subunit [Gemmata algarum]MDY3562836.1 efflux RND transporter permease subunit [Gemmata algarum]
MFTQILYRPALAIVISVILLFLGVLGIKTLPVAQFPDIAPPTVEVAIAYPGASANVLVDSVLIPLEQSINGVQGMRYIASSATSAGEAVIRIYFEPGTDPNINVVNVQNRVNIMMNRLPPLVQREGILVSQVVPSMLMYVNIYSEDPNADQKDLFNFANVFVMPRLKRIQGMGIPRNLGNRAFAMRIWLNPDSMRRYNIATDEVMEALAKQSVIGSPGRLGQATGITSQSKEYVLTYVGRYNKKEQYENIILRETAEGEILRLKDICGVKEIKDGKEVQKSPGVELGSEFFDIYSDINGRPAASIILKQSPGSNAAEVIEEIKAELGRIEKESFPPGMKYELSYDVSRFLEASTEKVLHTLIEAFILVSLVVYMFLGDVRSTLIPILAVPVSLIGTFFVLKLMGMSINLITLFAMVLAIGVVVDDAIVVVEAVHAKMAEKHLSPYRATMEVLHEISGAIIAITLVMTSVFVPVTFVPGPVGQFYRQFGITMATSIILSGVVALTLTPVLCAMILKPHGHAPGHGHTGHAKKRFSLQTTILYIIGAVLILGPMVYLAHHLWGELGFLLIALPVVRKPFDRAVEWVTARYAGVLRLIVTRRVLTMGVVGGFAAGVVGVNLKLASGFIPGEDQGIIYAVIQTPPGSTLEYTNAKSQNLEAIARDIKEVTSVTSLAGYEVLTEGRGSNAGTCIINLKTWSERERTTREIIEELEAKSRQMTDVKLEFFEPPAVPGFGAAGGFSMRLLDKTNTTDYQRLGEVTEKFMAALEKRKELKNLFTFYTADYPQYELIINNDVAMQKGVSIGKALDNLNILIGSTYEQGFILFNQFYKVYVQSSPEFRRYPEDLDNLFVKSEREVEIKNEKGETRKVRVEGDMVPYSAFMKLEKKQGLNEITRYNLYPSAAIQGAPAAGYSSGQAIKAIQEVAAETLPYGYGIGWEGLSFDESKKGIEVEVPKLLHVEVSPSILIFAIVVVFVYLVLVAQYESFLLPMAVILSLPVGIFGSFFCLQALGLSNDVYAQIGLIMLVGLLGKNAILIVEFAVQRRQEGQSLIEAAIEGGKLRFRPIQMTSFAFIAGLLPLVVATGAGAIGNRTIGTTAAGGMLVGTVIGILVIPGLYYLFGRMADGRKLLADEVDGPLSEVFTHHATEHQHTPDGHHAPAEHLPFDAGPADVPPHHTPPSDETGV